MKRDNFQSGDSEDPMNQAVTKFSTNLLDESDNLFEEICNYISQGVLKCKLTHGTRCKEIEDMGFKPPPGKTIHSLSINHVLILAGILLIFLMLNFIVFFPVWEGHEKTLLMAFATVLIIGFLIDAKHLKKLSENWRRWAEACLQAIGTMAAAWLVHYVLVDIVQPGGRVPELYRILFVSGTIGFLIGAVVPTWYRHAHTAKKV